MAREREGQKIAYRDYRLAIWPKSQNDQPIPVPGIPSQCQFTWFPFIYWSAISWHRPQTCQTLSCLIGFSYARLELPCSPCQPSKLVAMLMCSSIPPSMKPSPHPLADAGAGFCILRNIIAPFSLNLNCLYSSLHYKLLRASIGSSLCFYDT